MAKDIVESIIDSIDQDRIDYLYKKLSHTVNSKLPKKGRILPLIDNDLMKSCIMTALAKKIIKEEQTGGHPAIHGLIEKTFKLGKIL